MLSEIVRLTDDELESVCWTHCPKGRSSLGRGLNKSAWPVLARMPTDSQLVGECVRSFWNGRRNRRGRSAGP